MRNDARPIGEEFRDIAEHDHDKDEKRDPAAAGRDRADNTPFVVHRDPGDEELPPDSSDR